MESFHREGRMAIGLLSISRSYLVQCREAVDVGRVNVGAPGLQDPGHLVLVRGRARRQEHASLGELDALVGLEARPLGLDGLLGRVRLAPALELLGALEQRRRGPLVQAAATAHCAGRYSNPVLVPCAVTG